MKKLILLLLAFLVQSSFSQDITKFQKSIDSLKSIRTEYEDKIKDLNRLIKQIEDQKTIDAFEKFENIKYVLPSQLSVNIRDKNSTDGKILFTLNKGAEITLIDFDDKIDYWFVSYENTLGYLNDVFVNQSPAIADYKKYLVVKKVQLAEEKKRMEALKNEENKKLEAQKSEEREKLRTKQAEEVVRLAKLKTAEDQKKQKMYFEQRKQQLYNKYGSEIGNKILDGKIWLGMKDDMAKESWGNPDKNNRTVGTWGVHEQWIYDDEDTYLYFENGILTSWQDAK